MAPPNSAATRADHALTVQVSQGNLEASLRIPPQPDGATPLTLADAYALLAAAGVCHGIDPVCVERALRNPGLTFDVARASPPIHGANGRLECTASLLATSGRPHLDEFGQVQLFDLDLVRNVEADAVLATLVAATPGVPGINVRGQAIPSVAGRPARLRAGAGALLTEDGASVVARVAGHATLTGDTVSVSPVFTVRGDVGPATGHIDFIGSVTVYGSVRSGFRVRAGSDVEVQGSIEGGDVQAGGNVSVRYGIQGHGTHGRVTAGGSVRAKFVEYAEVHAEHAVFASDGIVQSTVEAGTTVEVIGRHGAILGGRVLARESIVVRDLGSAHGVRTEVIAGVAPDLLVDARAIRARQTEIARTAAGVQERLAFFQEKQRFSVLSPVARDALVQLHEAYRALLDERTSNQARLTEIVETLHALHGATIDVSGTCHPEVVITIGTSSHTAAEPARSVRFQRHPETFAVEAVPLT